MSTEFTQKMKKLRANIDVLDASLLDLLGMKVADDWSVKKKANVAVLQSNVGMKF
jgi:chorismate mutase